MTANLIAICGTVLSGLLLAVVEWLKVGQAQAVGGKLEAAKVSEAAAVGEAKIAAAVVAAPATRLAVIDQLKVGAF